MMLIVKNLKFAFVMSQIKRMTPNLENNVSVVDIQRSITVTRKKYND